MGYKRANERASGNGATSQCERAEVSVSGSELEGVSVSGSELKDGWRGGGREIIQRVIRIWISNIREAKEKEVYIKYCMYRDQVKSSSRVRSNEMVMRKEERKEREERGREGSREGRRGKERVKRDLARHRRR